MRSPKARFKGVVNFAKPVKGVGSEVMFTADSVEELVSYAKAYAKHNYTLVISENKKVYPSFDWQVVKTIKHDAE